MEITEIKVFPIKEDKLKAFVSVIFDGCFMVNDIKVIQGRDGLFISMPSRRKKNGRYKDVAHPLNNETRQWIEGEILGEYERVSEGGGQGPRRPAAEPPAAAAEPVASPKPAPRPLPEPRPQPTPVPVSPPAPEPQPEPAAAPEPEESDSLEEVAEKHLRDSFWST